MKPLLSILIFLSFAGCSNNSNIGAIQVPAENCKTVIVQLKDSLGGLTMTLPARYDTSFSCTDYSDCGKPCNEIKYRFQPKSLRVTKESGGW